MAELKDSGARREFESGAVRDIQEGKGRCDLLPLDVVSGIYSRVGDDKTVSYTSIILARISDFQETGKITYLAEALDGFLKDGPFTSWSDMFLEVAIHFEDGARKYGDNNWQKGIPVRCYIDSAVRHYLKYLRGDNDEPHHRAFCWNILCAIWTCIHKPELNDYAQKESGSNESETAV